MKKQNVPRASRMNFQGYTVNQRIDSAVVNKIIQALKLQKKMKSKIPKKAHEI